MFSSLLPSFQQQIGSSKLLNVADFDWAVHPGGQAILDGARDVMGWLPDQLRASQEVYCTRGNASSPTVLIVLDKLRRAEGREQVVATSFGPWLSIEMAMLRRCR